MAFVVLALAGGIGLVIYAGLWLVLVVGRPPRSLAIRAAGGLLLVIAVPLMLSQTRQHFPSGPMAVILLLIGLALSLWTPSKRGPLAPAPTLGIEPVTAAVAPVVVRQERVRREPSLLGRATLGLAVTVAAAGAMIDLANGGRLHPEQWLGAAAVLCGAGMLIGIFLGRARWLIVPAVAFAGAGFVGGVSARVGVRLSAGDRSVYVAQHTEFGHITRSTTIGHIEVDVDGVPESPTTIDARTGFGDVHLVASKDVKVDVIADIDHGVARREGRLQPKNTVLHLGPAGAADVTVNVRIGYGDLDIDNFEYYYSAPAVPVPPQTLPIVTAVPSLPGSVSSTLGALIPVTDGLAATSDGWFVFGSGTAVIDAHDQVVSGFSNDQGNGSTTIDTDFGPFTLLPHSLLLTPTGQLFDLGSIRKQITANANVDATPTPEIVTQTSATVPNTVVTNSPTPANGPPNVTVATVPNTVQTPANAATTTTTTQG